jgi:MoxR-like ATPase
MQEHSVTTAGQIFQLKEPFFVLATQNPIEKEGTYPLPEAQLDRFMFKVVVPFLNRDELNEVVSRTILKKAVEIPKLLDSERIMSLRKILDNVVVTDALRDYAVRLVLATHPISDFAPPRVRQFVKWGASPRAAQALIRAARVRALAEGRAHVAFEDIRHFACEVLGHRMLLNYDGQAESLDIHDIVKECVASLSETM